MKYAVALEDGSVITVKAASFYFDLEAGQLAFTNRHDEEVAVFSSNRVVFLKKVG